jgi:hypothetical protein
VNADEIAQYDALCANVDLALRASREMIDEWDQRSDPHGWWHDRSRLIALCDEIDRLRGDA